VADLGFSGVVEKFEEHWGKRPTRWLLLTIGLGVSAVCVGAVWQWLVAPVLTFVGSPQRSQTMWSFATAAFGVGAGVALGSSFIRALSEWRWLRSLRIRIDSMEAELTTVEARVHGTISESRELLNDSKGWNGKSRELLVDLLTAAQAMVLLKNLPEASRTELKEQIGHLSALLADTSAPVAGDGLGE
jgi:hypothetical protein